MVNDGWQWLVQDVSIVGGFRSPMFSWLGALAILALCLWHSLFLIRGVMGIRFALGRVQAPLARLLRSRLQTTKEWLVIPALAKKQAQLAHMPEARRDLDDLAELDRVMRAERLFASEWLSYRKSFAIEQPSWFIEPTVHTGRSAGEFFTFDALCADHLNVRLYQQLPSFMTGIGLMFTFLAILIGLSKLHANGSQIDGMQGLINGLAGKFVTSVVGLACANTFVWLEKSLWYRLGKRHRKIVAILDEMFPQKVQQQHSSSPSTEKPVMVTGVRHDVSTQLVDTVHQRLGSMVAALTSLSQSLDSQRAGDLSAKQDQLASEIGKAVQQSLRPLLDPLLSAVRDLTDSVDQQRRSVQLTPSEMNRMFGQLRDHLEQARPLTTAGDVRPSESGWKLSRLRGVSREAEAR